MIGNVLYIYRYGLYLLVFQMHYRYVSILEYKFSDLIKKFENTQIFRRYRDWLVYIMHK